MLGSNHATPHNTTQGDTMYWRDKIRNLPDGTYVLYANHPLPITPSKGYWVGAGEYSLDDIELDGTAIFGVWRDNLTDTQYIDRVVYTEDLDYAIELGKSHEQLAIWDIANNKEIRL